MRMTLSALLLCSAGSGWAQVVVEFPIPTASAKPQCLAPGGDGNVWVAERASSQAARVTPDGVITEFPVVGTGGSLTLPLQCLTRGPDGNVWFTVTKGINSQVGYITPAGTVTVLPKLVLTATFFGITTGPDGNLWITEAGFGSSRIGRFTTAGALTEYQTPTNIASFNVESSIVAGPDGALWFTETDANQIGRLDPTQLRTCTVTPTDCITEFPIPTADSGPGAITVGPDGALWFIEKTANQIARITTDGKVTHEFFISTSNPGASDITTGPDGNLWFTEKNVSRIARMTTRGIFTEFPLSIGKQPEGITTGPDGNIWFGEVNGNAIGRIILGGAITPTPTPTPPSSHRGHVTPLFYVTPKPVSGRQ
jgi:streptogramin lyase